jgi:DNA-directed RNA polymerase
MVESYNASPLSAVNYLKLECDTTNEEEHWSSVNENKENSDIKIIPMKYILKNSDNKDKYLIEQDFIKIVKSIKDILLIDYPKLTTLRNYLKEIAKLCNLLELTIPWTLPSGLLVDQSYLQSEQVKISPFTYNRKTFTIRVISENKLDKRKQIRALMPNLIHSLDATSLTLLYLRYKTINPNIFTVHDCFAVPAPYVESLIDLLQKVYLDLYSDKAYLIQFDDSIRKNIVESLGKVFNKDNTKILVNDKWIDFPNVDDIFQVKATNLY